MYNNSYSHSKLGVSAKKINKAKGKSCGYYMKVVFFFSSLTQTLIIVSLVLFLIYGQPEQSAAEKRLQILDPIHNELKVKYGHLQDESRNLTWKMNITNRRLENMHRNMTKLKKLANDSISIILGLQNKLIMCQMTPSPPCNCPTRPLPSSSCQPNSEIMILQNENNQLKRQLDIVSRNCSETYYVLKYSLDSANKEMESLRLEAIEQHQKKATAEKEIELFKKKCKEDFIKPLEVIPEIATAFRQKIDNFIPELLRFHISCNTQCEHLEQIRSNCSSLSKEVENKFQPYLNDVGLKVSQIAQRVSHLEANKMYLDRTLFECKQNLSSLQDKNYKNLREAREKYDKTLEKVLLEQRKLRIEKEMMEETMKLMESELIMLKEKINTSNLAHRPPSPKPLPGTIPFSGGAGMGAGSGINKFTAPGSGGFMPNIGSSGSSSDRWGGQNTPGSGRSAVGVTGPSSGLGSFGVGLSHTGSSGTGADNFGVSRTGPGLGSSGSGVGTSRTGSGGAGLGSSGSLGSTGTLLNMGSSATGTGRTGSGGTGLGSSGSLGSTGMGFNMGSSATGIGRTGSGGTGLGSSGSLGSTGTLLNMGSSATGTGRTGSGGTGLGSSGSLGSTGMGFNMGSSATGTGRIGSGGTGLGSSGSLGSTGTLFNMGSSATGTGRTGSGGTGLGSSGSLGSTGMGFNMGSSATGTGRTGSGGTGLGSSGSMGPSGTGLGNVGFGGAGSSRTGSGVSGVGGTGGFGGFGSAGTGTSRNGFGTGRTGHGGSIGQYGGNRLGATDPISNHLRDIQKILNQEWQ